MTPSSIPAEIRRLFLAALPYRLALLAQQQKAAAAEYPDIHPTWFNPDTGASYRALPPDTPVPSSSIFPNLQLGTDPLPPDFDKAAWVLVKGAADTPQPGPQPSAVLGTLADVQGWGRSPWGQINSLWGGSRPLANILAGAALGAGLGGAGGWLAEQLLPEDLVERGRLRRTTAGFGALLGAAPGLYHLADAWGQKGNGWKALTESWPPPAAKAAQDLQQELGWSDAWLSGEGKELLKSAAWGAGAFDVPTIDVDREGAVIWDDRFTPAPVAATASGLMTGASASRGSNLVSAGDIARVAAGAGAGWLGGKLVGGTLGALAGLTPGTQKKIQDTGLWAGLLSAVVPLTWGGH